MTTPGGPAPIIPVPASGVIKLRGRRVIVGVPGVGFRNDLRADDSVVQGDRTYVPVLTEQDYYRAEADGVEAFAALVPIERVWVEQVGPVRPDSGHGRRALDEPPASAPKACLDAPSLLGRRVIQRVPDGFIRDLRATTPVHLGVDGITSVQVCGEAEWYQWATTGATPLMNKVEATQLWLE